MFCDAIDNFRCKTNDKVLFIDENAELERNYQICCEFLDENSYADNEDISALNDYITYGQFGEGYVHKRLIDILASLCKQYTKKITLSINNQSYCNSMMTAHERAENTLYR